MSLSKVIAVRAPTKDWEKWTAQAKESNIPRNSWIRRTLNESCAHAKALQSDSKPVETQNPTKDLAYPQTTRRCVHRLMPGTFCKKCGVTR